MIAVVFLPPAEEEMIAAACYYESQSKGLGTDFLAEVQRTLVTITAHPKAAPRVKKDIRRRLLRRFPFGVLYSIRDSEIVILAVMHLHRRPGYWQDRVEPSEEPIT
ncbi:MAG: type II toxin-antitoxin system RelE/ParE family toxin [Candidatus Methylomirabilaceae bacterium]